MKQNYKLNLMEIFIQQNKNLNLFPKIKNSYTGIFFLYKISKKEFSYLTFCLLFNNIIKAKTH
jgi:hypothetical protein